MRQIQNKEMAAIAAGWQVGRQPEDAANDNELAPPSSSAPPSSCRKARAHYMNMMREEWEEQFRETQADANYNHNLLQKHMQVEE